MLDGHHHCFQAGPRIEIHSSLESKYIQAAFRYFYSRKKPLVLYMVDRPASLPPELASAKAVRHEPLNPTYSFDELIIEVKSRKRG